MSLPSEKEQLQFINGIQRILDEGSFVATYKFALLTALAEFAVQSGQDGVDPEKVKASDLAESFIIAYWQQARPYVTARGNDGKWLRMSSGKQPVIYNQIVCLYSQYDGKLTALRNNIREWQKLKSDVAKTIAQMPLWKLQVIGRDPQCFLYRQRGQGYQGREIELLPGVLFNLRHHYKLIRNLVQGAWLRHVRRMNLALLGESDLDEFLFGSERTVWPGLRELLREVQKNTCLYCNRKIYDQGDIDHFIPWSRYPTNLGHNFVLSHASCNRSKNNLLASPTHLEKWCKRNSYNANSLAEGFNKFDIFHNHIVTTRITKWAYNQAEYCRAKLWHSKNEIVKADSSWRIILSAC